MRYRDVGGTPILTRWSGRYGAYARIHGMMIPTTAEVEWAPHDGKFAVWRGHVATADYVFSR